MGWGSGGSSRRFGAGCFRWGTPDALGAPTAGRTVLGGSVGHRSEPVPELPSRSPPASAAGRRADGELRQPRRVRVPCDARGLPLPHLLDLDVQEAVFPGDDRRMQRIKPRYPSMVNKAWRAAVRHIHPDKAPPGTSAEELERLLAQIQAINRAADASPCAQGVCAVALPVCLRRAALP